ncbi:pyrimidine reductase family protein [Nocardia africana]
MTALASPLVLSGSELNRDDLVQLYAYPPAAADRPYVRVNFVASLDGATATNGTSAELTSPLDREVLQLLRDLADVVLVGAGTIRQENYIGIRADAAVRAERLSSGMSEVAPIAVVTARADIDPDSRLLTHTSVPPIILTTTTASAAAKHGLERAGAHVLELGAGPISPTALIDALGSLGLRRIICEGGPLLTGQLATHKAIDELCLTTVPTVVGGRGSRVTDSDCAASLRLQCQHIIIDSDGAQLARWTAGDATASVEFQ